MEEARTKRRRVYSLEPNKIVQQGMFTRKYLNYLVPALVKIKEKKSSAEDNNHCDLQNVLKYEVDMALVFSAQGFAWSNALKVNLQKDVNVGRSTSTVENGMVSLTLSSNPSSKPETETKKVMRKSKELTEEMEDIGTEENEDEKVRRQLRSLRRLIPGGEEIFEEQMPEELKSYISCLQMQVNILQCLAETP